MERRKRRAFTKEFKAETVRLVVEGKRSIAEVARDLDLTESALRQWVRQSEVDAGRGKLGELTTAEREELARLRREVKTLRLEREILKQAAAFFAKPWFNLPWRTAPKTPRSISSPARSQ